MFLLPDSSGIMSALDFGSSTVSAGAWRPKKPSVQEPLKLHVFMGIFSPEHFPLLPASAGDIRDLGSIPGSGRSPGGRHGNPLQCSCLENPMEEEPGGL